MSGVVLGSFTITDVLPLLAPVVEAPRNCGQWWPWVVSDRSPFSFVHLGAGISAEDIGLVFAQLVDYNHIEGQDTEALQTGIIEAEGLLLPGGLQTSYGNQEINPGCCCGLETWREWEQVLKGGSPWLGHDPAPWVELCGNAVRVWSDGGLNERRDAFSIAFECQHFEAEFERAGKELRAFLTLSAAWAQSAGFSDVGAICRKLDRCFAISGPCGDA
jgi:hypothetical protein